jgi:hypothetical protein
MTLEKPLDEDVLGKIFAKRSERQTTFRLAAK